MTFGERLALVNEKQLNILAVDIGNDGGLVYNVKDEIFIRRMGDLQTQWETIAHATADIIVAEDVHAWEGQGIVSTGTLMKNRGRIEGMAIAVGIEVHFIQPIKWIECFTMQRTKSFKNKRQWKKHLAEIAKEIAPDSLLDDITLETADAFLIWNYAASQQTNEPIKKMGLKFA